MRIWQIFARVLAVILSVQMAVTPALSAAQAPVTTVTERKYDETAALTQLVAAAYNFDVGGQTNLTVYRDTPVNGSLGEASQAEFVSQH